MANSLPMKCTSNIPHMRYALSVFGDISSLVPRLPDLFSVTREKRGSLVKLITCVTSGGTNFHIWHSSKLAKIRTRDTESLSSSFSTLQSAMNQQVKTLQPLRYKSKTAICMATRSVSTPRWNQLGRGHARGSSYHANHSF